jgi:hypothetical protein
MKNQNRRKISRYTASRLLRAQAGHHRSRQTLFRWLSVAQGLNEGDDVQILSFHYGYYWVVKGGRKFRINLTNVE